MGRFIAWKSFYSVGNAFLDDQHKQILEIINDLYAAMDEGNDLAVVKPLLERMLQYTNTHFKCEERIMQESGYPGFEQHKELHDELRRKTAGLRAHMGLVLGADLLRFLKAWWLEHIQEEDQRYVPYLGSSVTA